MAKKTKKDEEIESLKRSNQRYKSQIAKANAYAKARKDLVAEGYKPT